MVISGDLTGGGQLGALGVADTMALFNYSEQNTVCMLWCSAILEKLTVNWSRNSLILWKPKVHLSPCVLHVPPSLAILGEEYTYLIPHYVVFYPAVALSLRLLLWNCLQTSGKIKVKFFQRHEGVLGKWKYISIHSLTSALDGGQWSASRPGRFTPRESALGTYWIGG
jgi:hypothetical protein